MIKYLLKIYNAISAFNKDENVSYETKNFYLVMTCSVPILLFVGAVFWLDNSTPMLSYFCFSFALLTVFLFFVAFITGKHYSFSYYFCIILNFFFTPTMFFLSEGVRYGMVLFFVLGCILTVVLLGRSKLIFVYVTVELLYDIFIVIYSYLHVESVYTGQSNLNQEQCIALAFGIVAATLIFIFLYQNYIHREVKHSIEMDNNSILKAENTKGRFLANMTHEIRTPMNAIIGMTDLILRDNLSKNAREYADTIKEASSQLLQIINNILEFSKLDSGRAELINNVYSFRKVVEEIVDNVSLEYMKDDISLHIFLPKDIPDRLFGDEVRIKQVLRYLLYSPLSKNNNGSVNLEIDYDYDDEKCIINLKFRIASTGGGLNEEDIRAIYNAYSNYDSRQKTDYNRTGLEISICQKILNMMGGELIIDSIEGIGNALEFSFENYVVNERPIVEVNNENTVSGLIYINDKNMEYVIKRIVEECNMSVTYAVTPLGFKGALEKRNFNAVYVSDAVYDDVKEYIESFDCEDKTYVFASMNKCIGDFGKCKILRRPVYLFNFIESINGQYDTEKYKYAFAKEEIKYPYARVLCVDDSEVNLKVFQNILKEFEINPTLCNSGEEALAILASNEFDIMLIDHKMPNMDGSQLVQNIINMGGPNASVPLICATADFGPAIKEKLEHEGFIDYIAKPINIKYLEEVLNKYLSEDLRVYRAVNKKQTAQAIVTVEDEADKIDPVSFSPEIGIKNLGGSSEAYLSVLLAYYKEGVQKLADVPKQFEDGDISLYTTNVHALKSSSATVGCMGISPMFKALEFAGKENNIQFISDNSQKTFDYFVEVLEKVKDYLDSEGMLELDNDSSIYDQDIVAVDAAMLNELSDCILKMDIRRCEEIIDELSSLNFGKDINDKIKQIKNSFENFEYIEIKKYLEEII